MGDLLIYLNQYICSLKSFKFNYETFVVFVLKPISTVDSKLVRQLTSHSSVYLVIVVAWELKLLLVSTGPQILSFTFSFLM